ncbi:MAG TPA: DUF2207 domain-containing protein [Acidimicrobiales bacterium]|nr:DUF2207 domain-containing protein [Acidimicrobiales bacterium]
MPIAIRGRHALVALAVLALGGLTAFGCVGPAVGPERIHSFAVTAIVREDGTVAVREVIDYDFGGESRHGIVRVIPDDGGTPEQVAVSSPTAPDQVQVEHLGVETTLRVGDPDRTVSGRHRYVVRYVLPQTVVPGGVAGSPPTFALDAIGATSEVPLTHARVTVLGATLDARRCTVGQPQSRRPCTITAVDGGYRVAEDHLPDHAGITVDGQVLSTSPASFPGEPPFEGRSSSDRWAWAGIVAGLGALGALAVFLACRQMGRNEVAGEGATEAAFVPVDQQAFGVAQGAPGTAPPPTPGARMVADTEMGELAGIDFVPPRGVEPWQAAVVAREVVDDRTIGAWFASQAAHDILVLDKDGQDVRLRPGPRAASADATVAPILNRALAGQQEIALGTYDPGFAAAWKEAGAAIDGWSVGSGTFRRRPPRYGAGQKGCLTGLTGLTPVVLVAVLLGSGDAFGGTRTTFAAIALALLVPGVVAMVVYRRLIRSLSARGSAIALRTESFRRFLHDSEAQHVEWAWQNGLLREYSAWAVALGEVDAWNGAMAASSVPPVEQHATSGVLAPALYASSFSSTTTAPSSSGSGGGGGFSGGGSVGGGGGGGSTGSW